MAYICMNVCITLKFGRNSLRKSCCDRTFFPNRHGNGPRAGPVAIVSGGGNGRADPRQRKSRRNEEVGRALAISRSEHGVSTECVRIRENKPPSSRAHRRIVATTAMGVDRAHPAAPLPRALGARAWPVGGSGKGGEYTIRITTHRWRPSEGEFLNPLGFPSHRSPTGSHQRGGREVDGTGKRRTQQMRMNKTTAMMGLF